jgi:quercetin dioxygenase-like cupin family protein
MRLIPFALAASLAVVTSAAVTPIQAQTGKMDLYADPGGVKWGPAPPSVPKGASIAVLSGDPSKDGPYVVRLKMPANYQIAAHHHPTTENVTVVSGAFHAGMGDKLDKKKGMAFKPGGFVAMPANMNHYAWTTAPTVVQIHGNGPFAIEYVNPADDPSKKQ